MSQKTKIANFSNFPMQSLTLPARVVDGPDAGKTYEQTFYCDPSVPRFQAEIGRLNSENAQLKSELEKYQTTMITSNDKTYCLTKKEFLGVEIINAKFSPVEENHQKNCRDLARFLRRQFGKAMTMSQIMGICESLIKILFDNCNPDTFQDAFHRKGEAGDNFVHAVRLGAEIIESFQFVWQDESPAMNNDRYVYYSQQIAKLADCCGYQANSYKTIFPVFTGDIISDARVFHTLISYYQHKMEKYQCCLIFVVNVFSQYPFLLGQNTDRLFCLINELEQQPGCDATALAQKSFSEIINSANKNVPQKDASTSVTDIQVDGLEYCAGFPSDGISAKAMQEHLKITSKSIFQKNVLAPLVSLGYLEKTCQKSASPYQKYRISPLGLTVLRQNRPGRTFFGLCQTVPEAIPTDPERKND